MHKIEEFPNIFERSSKSQDGISVLKGYNPPVVKDGKVKDVYRQLRQTSTGIRNVLKVSFEEDDSVASYVLPPDELYTNVIPPEGAAAAKAIEDLTLQQFVQQFYETYLVPVGAKECYNRLGEIAGNIEDLHSLYPKGVPGVFAEDSKASWNTAINFSFTVNEGLNTKPAKFNSIGFPPFVGHESVDAENYTVDLKSPSTVEELAQSSSFDTQNVLYKRGKATFRFPAFKQVNDNINMLQLLLNRAFGIESTYMNEWDLSLYMQEGLLSFTEKQSEDGDIIRVPKFVTTLTYGLLDDAPNEVLNSTQGNADPEAVDIDTVTPFASVNCAVSTRYAIDDSPIGQQTNTLNYVIADYPLSAYWYPRDQGMNDTQMNVSMYLRDMLAYQDVGVPFDETKPTGHFYTPDIYHGTDLSRSTRPLQQIIGYADDRYALLSGWNATDDQGDLYLRNGDTTNSSKRSNAYSFLPFWKQFYTSDEDGLSELDRYLQEIYAADQETSIIDAAFQIVDIVTSGNETFQDLKDEKRESFYDDITGKDYDDVVNQANMTLADQFGGIDTSDYKIAGFKIKGSGLLKMFLGRNKVSKKAMAVADSAGSFDEPAVSPSAMVKSATASKSGEPETVIENGQEVTVDTYAPAEPGDLCSKKSIGDGIAEWSPFLYGGPHGKYLSPLTLEGYTQFGNAMLSNVPTVDPYHAYIGGTFKVDGKNTTGIEFSKNSKRNGSYIDLITTITPNERDAVLNSGKLDKTVKIKSKAATFNTYTSNSYTVENYWQSMKWYTIKIKILWVKITIKLPNPSYFKLARMVNGWLNRLLLNTYDYGFDSSTAKTTTGRWETRECVQADWPNTPFRLIPTKARINDWKGTDWSSSTTISNIRSDESKYRRMTEWHAAADGSVIYTYRPEDSFTDSNSRRINGAVDYVVVPIQDGGKTTCGQQKDYVYRHWTPYSNKNSSWTDQLRTLWDNGVRETLVTLPIADARTNEITNFCCGAARIVKSEASTWVQKLVKIGYYYELAHPYNRYYYGPYYSSYRYYNYCSHYVYTPRYAWVWERTSTETIYNMFFQPYRMSYNLPTEYLIRKEANFSIQRNKNSSNIIERWNVDGTESKARRFTSIGDGSRWSPELFPFTMNYMNKYGKYDPYLPLPGCSTSVHARNANGLRILQTRGFYYGDLAKTFREVGEVRTVKTTRLSKPTYVTTKNFTVLTPDRRNDIAVGLYRSSTSSRRSMSYVRSRYGNTNETMSRFTVKQNVLMTATKAMHSVSKYEVQKDITAMFKTAQNLPSLQIYQEGKLPYMMWYAPKDAINVFVDTATQQIAWLKELRDYADIYLSDNLIYDLYLRSVDNRIKNVISMHKQKAVYGGPMIQNNKAIQRARGAGGWTESYSEDINYHDALAIAVRVFNTSDPNKNTIRDLTNKRIKQLESILSYAKTLLSNFERDNTTVAKFVRLVTNTRSLLDCAVTKNQYAENVIFGSNGKYKDTLFTVDKTTTYDILRNPGAILWAYINVLYQVRKYWVNMRFNKRAGSYWQLRGLERALSFLIADSNAEDKSYSSKPKSIPQGAPSELKTKPITFVQARGTFEERLRVATSQDLTEDTYAGAVYVKVNYLGSPNPKASAKWNASDETYDGDQICYVNEVYKWARKPQDGLYYIMSSSINTLVKNSINLLSGTVNSIKAKQYTLTSEDYKQLTQLLKSMSKEQWKELTTYELSNGATDVAFDGYSTKLKGVSFEECIAAIAPVDKKLQAAVNAAESLTNINSDLASIAMTALINTLIKYKQEYYTNQLNSCLYPVYIKWTPQKVWSGSTENDKKGDWYIDEYQKQETKDVERKVTDLYGNVHTSSEAISAGITFDVAGGMDSKILLGSPKLLANSSVLEIACSSVDTVDLWRVQVPENVKIPIELLENKPVLVPAYNLDATINGLKNGTVTKSTRTVLAGISSNGLIPVLEPTEDMLTVNTLAALGKFKDISQTNIGMGDSPKG